MSDTTYPQRSSIGDTPQNPAGTRGRRPLDAVPESAFLQPEDLAGAEPRAVTDEFGRHLRPPLPCGPRRYPSLLLRQAEGTVLIDFPVAEFHTTLLEHVMTFRGATAAAYLRDLRVSVGRQSGCTDETGRWTVEEVGTTEPRSLLIRLRQEFEDPSGQPAGKDSYLYVARTGRVVVVVADLGWEMGSGRLDTVRGLAAAALRRAGTVR
ncbi:hypothetical protein AB0C12_26985 [Actinoplanes sp. NPDC048967]|uniref:hypothetical protein n=1 Tax=Actinoplanes sp. NPDC048967 TaxID=3155269 RepID=UPI0033C77AE5